MKKIIEDINFHLNLRSVSVYRGVFVFDKINRANIIYVIGHGTNMIRYINGQNQAYDVHIFLGENISTKIKKVNEKYGYDLYLWYKHIYKKIEKQQLEISHLYFGI